MFLIAAWLMFLFCVYCVIYESISERDWPRDTFKYLVMSGFILAMFY